MLIWLSFADPTKPPRQSFIGVIIVPIEDTEGKEPREIALEALEQVYSLGIHPGGIPMALGMPDDAFPADYCNRLLTKEELKEKDIGETTLPTLH